MKVKILRVVASNHTFSRVPFALSVGVPNIESYGFDNEFFDESEYSKIREFAKDMGIEISEESRIYGERLTLEGGKLYKR